jgi:hypothetical protein
MALMPAVRTAVAASDARLAFLHGPRWMTDSVEAVLASVSLAAEPLPQVDVMIADHGRHAVGAVNGNQLWSIAIPRRRWLETLIGQIVATCTMLLRRLVFVHAGAVEIDGRACILVGGSGAGKTSTVGALLACGATYLSDEVALLDPETATVVPFHLPMAIKPWTVRAGGPLPQGTDVARQGTVAFRLPDSLGRGCPLGTVIVLERAGRSTLAALPRAQALLRLARQPSSFQNPDRVDDAFRAWLRALQTAHCLEAATPRPAKFAPALVQMLRRSSRADDIGVNSR